MCPDVGISFSRKNDIFRLKDEVSWIHCCLSVIADVFLNCSLNSEHVVLLSGYQDL